MGTSPRRLRRWRHTLTASTFRNRRYARLRSGMRRSRSSSQVPDACRSSTRRSMRLPPSSLRSTQTSYACSPTTVYWCASVPDRSTCALRDLLYADARPHRRAPVQLENLAHATERLVGFDFPTNPAERADLMAMTPLLYRTRNDQRARALAPDHLT